MVLTVHSTFYLSIHEKFKLRVTVTVLLVIGSDRYVIRYERWPSLTYHIYVGMLC